MDNFEYLNQIAQSTHPQKSKSSDSSSFLRGPIFKIAAGGIILFLLLMIIGGLIGNAKGKSSDLTKQLYVRSNNLNSVIDTNSKSLKSSRLRALSLSLSSVLTNTTRDLSNYLTPEDGKSKDKKNALTPNEKLTTSENELLENLNTALTNARLNGILDRTYSNQITLQISLLMSLTTELYARTKDEKLQEILVNFYNNLQPIHQSFSEYSEAET